MSEDTPDENEACPDPKADMGLHCDHWFDGEGCCYCGAAEMPNPLRILKGMEMLTEKAQGDRA